jgi:hypothetical protein
VIRESEALMRNSYRLPNTKSLREARAAHDAFLRSKGIDPDRKSKHVGIPPDPLNAERHAVKQELPPLSNKVGNGFARKQVFFADLPIAQTYHKGPLMVVTDMSTLKGSKRRD